MLKFFGTSTTINGIYLVEDFNLTTLLKTDHTMYTFSLNWPTEPILSLCLNVRPCVPLFACFFNVLLHPFTKFESPIAKRNDIGLRFSNFCSEMVEYCGTEKPFFSV